MKRLTVSVILIFLYICLLSSCTFQNTTKNDEQILTISTNLKLETQYKLHTISTGNDSIIYKNKMTGYPTGEMDRNHSFLYFTTRDNSKYIQLFSLNLKTNEKKQLTSISQGIINVDTIRIDDNKKNIYMRIVQKNHRNFSLAKYNLKTNQLKIFNSQERNISIKTFDYISEKGEIFIVSNSETERYNLMEKSNLLQIELEPCNYTLSLLDDEGNKMRSIGNIKENIVNVSLSRDGKKALIEIDKGNPFKESTLKQTVFIKDFKSGSLSPIFSTPKGYNFIEQIQYSKDEEKIYFLAEDSKQKPLYSNGRKLRIKSIFSYNLTNKSISQVYKMNNGNVNNFIVLR
ncbi:hypothetical protein [Clostridium sp.]|uniref:hypothetical protein n=1 Tax=Clostridium sp. TaxID=1506 RepID=UPI002FDE4E79